MRRRTPLLLLLALATASLVPSEVSASSPPGPHPAAAGQPVDWKQRLNELVAGKTVGVALREEGAFLYRRADTKRRTPASNEKLLLAMALLDRVDPDVRLETSARAASTKPGGIVSGDLWLIGRGDPGLGPGRLGTLASKIEDAGITRINGSVRGAVTYFAHDWWAKGWKPFFPDREVALPSALTFQGNQVGGTHIADPERRAAVELTRRLRARGIKVAGKAGTGKPPAGLERVASILSPRLAVLLRKMLRPSSNFRAELLGKWLGVEASGVPGTIAAGASALEAWAEAAAGVGVTAFDGSGLSYDNRVPPSGMVKLLGEAEEAAWGPDLFEVLPGPGQGTLEERLSGIPVKAKTGTLTRISTLSGWVFLQHTGTWAEFSIMSRGMNTDAAKNLENRIVRIMWRHAA